MELMFHLKLDTSHEDRRRTYTEKQHDTEATQFTTKQTKRHQRASRLLLQAHRNAHQLSWTIREYCIVQQHRIPVSVPETPEKVQTFLLISVLVVRLFSP
ncbi:Hypothetical protein, putative [Bodo saltans]|uniref:Uncharacterized protein n=1 Tax=Bodo saltans TaxID=75058 RepID=A0A0S4KIY5_BODSA|nr:Hypothetical protein, putative [Bodo saltans]|eukprot:CUI14933.1 Hypothetical protein, putative [Bodo saltans]